MLPFTADVLGIGVLHEGTRSLAKIDDLILWTKTAQHICSDNDVQTQKFIENNCHDLLNSIHNCGKESPSQPVDESIVPADPSEAIAHITEAEAARIAEELWASNVGFEHRVPHRLLLLTFSRHGKAFDAALLSSGPAQRLTSLGYDVIPEWASGAKVLAEEAEPSMFEEKLGPHHVIIHESDEQDVSEALRVLPYNQRPRLKSGKERLPIPSSISFFQDTSDNEEASSCSSASSMKRKRTMVQEDECLDENLELPVQQVEWTLSVKRTFIDMPLPSAVSPRTVKTV
jgi:hypothetical protein